MTAENTPAPDDDLPEQLRIRREKRASLLERGIEPYPVAVARTKSLKEIREKYSNLEIDVATRYRKPHRSNNFQARYRKTLLCNFARR